VLGLVIVDHETGVNDAGDPAEQSQQNAQDETQDPARHQNRDRREDDTKKVAERFQLVVIGVAGNHQCNWHERNDRLPALILGRVRDIDRLRRQPIHVAVQMRFFCIMKKNLIALTFLGLAAIFIAGCASSPETTTTTTTTTRERSSMYAR
jgi:hypothetical protein